MVRSKIARTGLVLLTGSQGSIGRHLEPILRAAGHAVRGLDLRPASQPGVDHQSGDLLDPDAVRVAMRDVTAVVHAGGIPWDRGDGSAVIAANVLGTWNVLRAAVDAGVERVVAFSSINAQGSVRSPAAPRSFPIDDDYQHDPRTPYQLSKHLMEDVCRSVSERDGLVTVCLRPVFVLHPASPHARGIGTAAFIDAWRDDYWAYVDVRDVGDAVVRSLRVEGVIHERLLLAASDTSVPEEASALIEREYPDVPWPGIARERYFETDPHRSLIDCRHARDVLGWEPRHSWRDGTATDPDGAG